MKLTRRTFHGALLSASALAQTQAAEQNQPAPPQPVDLPPSSAPSGDAGDRFELPGPPNPRTRWTVVGLPRKYFMEWLPALFERTLVVEQWKTPASRLHWIFTGPMGGFTVEAGAGKVRLAQRYDDSPGLAKVPPVQPRPARHPEGLWEESTVSYNGALTSITVRVDYRLRIHVLLNGREVLVQDSPMDVNRHQVALEGEQGGFRARMLPETTVQATIQVNPATAFQEMVGWGGTTTPPAYDELSEEGVRIWWNKFAEYNLLLHREYPTGALLNPQMTNWDTKADASPHYYGDNFPNCETTDFDFVRRVRKAGGKVIFEFWELPVWARRRDANGKLTEAPDMAGYAKAMVGYCKASKEKTGAPPEVVGVQNEVKQSPQDWQQMALTLRKALDDAGFKDVLIHMHNPPFLADGITAAKTFRERPDVWKTIDYATSNMYDYQNFFYDPDGFDARLREMKEAAGDKKFLAAELCVNNSAFQNRTYRLALTMGQLYHKVLTLVDSCGVLYCWTLLNVTQPSYGWTRTLMVPDPEHGFIPVASSHQLRVFGAYSRRVREGMKRVQATSSNPDLLVTAFKGAGNQSTLVILNRSMAVQNVALSWPGASFLYRETTGPHDENTVAKAQASGSVTVRPGEIITLSNVELGKA